MVTAGRWGLERWRTGKVTRRWRVILGGLGAGLSAGLLLLGFSYLPAGTALELRTLDLLFLLRGPLPAPKELVIVAIDEELPPVPNLRWPWPRRYHARLIERLRSAGAKTVGFDLIFDQPSAPEDDGAFERALAQAGNVVLASDVAFSETEQVRTTRSVEPLPRFAAAAKTVATALIPSDPDHYLRSARFTFLRRPAFALEVARLSMPEGSVQLGASGDRLLVGGKEVPLLGPGRVLINYLGPAQSVVTVPYSEAVSMDPPQARQTFQDKIVLVGRAPVSTITLRKLAADTFATPFLHASRTYMPGIEVHANVLATILGRRFIAATPPAAMLALYFAWGALLGLAMGGVRPLVGALLGLIASPIPLWAAHRLFTHSLVWLPWAGLTLEVPVTYGGILLLRYLVTERDRAFLRGAFEHYVHPAIIDQIVAEPDSLKLGGGVVHGTILFADIKDFTVFAEKLSAEDLVSFLNKYLAMGTDIIIQHRGTLSRYIGDAIMAIWGAPVPVEDHARLACEAALKLQQGAAKGSPEWTRGPEWTRQDLPKFHVRIGVHTGPMVVGNVGSGERFDYTAMGDTVNLASRLEGLCKTYGVGILISETTVKEAGVPVRELDLVRVVGREQPVRVFEPIAAEVNVEMVQAFEQGLAAYRHRAFGRAVERFERVLQLVPGDEPARVFVGRCRAFLREPPPPDWNGVFEPGVK